MDMADDPATETAAANLARNLRTLREAQGLTQTQLATRAGVPRATLAHLETGGGNPTLMVTVRIASALNVTIEELIAPPRATGRLYRRDQLPTRTRAGVTVAKLLPDPLPGIELERFSLPAGGLFRGVPHAAGTREYLFCERGAIELVASGVAYTLAAGDVVVFRGDQKHSYRNLADGESVAFSVVLLAPSGA
jgi:XRE family transcriptional regulator, regulator of sulfur utilization